MPRRSRLLLAAIVTVMVVLRALVASADCDFVRHPANRDLTFAAATISGAVSNSAIQAAIDSASTAGGGRVVVGDPGKTYLLNRATTRSIRNASGSGMATISCALTLPSNVTLDLNGSILKLANGQSAGSPNGVVLVCNNVMGDAYTDVNVSVLDGMLDGNRTNNPDNPTTAGGGFALFFQGVTRANVCGLAIKEVREGCARFSGITGGYQEEVTCDGTNGDGFIEGLNPTTGINQKVNGITVRSFTSTNVGQSTLVPGTTGVPIMVSGDARLWDGGSVALNYASGVARMDDLSNPGSGPFRFNYQAYGGWMSTPYGGQRFSVYESIAGHSPFTFSDMAFMSSTRGYSVPARIGVYNSDNDNMSILSDLGYSLDRRSAYVDMPRFSTWNAGGQYYQPKVTISGGYGDRASSFSIRAVAPNVPSPSRFNVIEKLTLATESCAATSRSICIPSGGTVGFNYGLACTTDAGHIPGDGCSGVVGSCTSYSNESCGHGDGGGGLPLQQWGLHLNWRYAYTYGFVDGNGGDMRIATIPDPYQGGRTRDGAQAWIDIPATDANGRGYKVKATLPKVCWAGSTALINRCSKSSTDCTTNGDADCPSTEFCATNLRKSCSIDGNCGSGGYCAYMPATAEYANIYALNSPDPTRTSTEFNMFRTRQAFMPRTCSVDGDCGGGTGSCESSLCKSTYVYGAPGDSPTGNFEAEQPYEMNTTIPSVFDVYQGFDGDSPTIAIRTGSGYLAALQIFDSNLVPLTEIGIDGSYSVLAGGLAQPRSKLTATSCLELGPGSTLTDVHMCRAAVGRVALSSTETMVVGGLGIGLPTTETLAAQLHVDHATQATMLLESHGSGADDSPVFASYKTRGSHGSKSDITTGDKLISMSFNGRGNGAMREGAGIECYAAEPWDATHGGSTCNFYSAPNTTVGLPSTPTMAFGANQEVIIPKALAVGFNGAPFARAHIYEIGQGSPVLRLETETAQSVNPTLITLTNSTQTTSTTTAGWVFTIANDRGTTVHADLSARCVTTNGCTAGQVLGCTVIGTIKNVGGTSSLVGAVTRPHCTTDMTGFTTPCTGNTYCTIGAGAGSCGGAAQGCILVTAAAANQTIDWYVTYTLTESN